MPDGAYLEMFSHRGIKVFRDDVFNLDQEVGPLQQFPKRGSVVRDDFGNAKDLFTGLRIASHI